MSGVHRLLNRREKRTSSSADDKAATPPKLDVGELGPVFTLQSKKSRSDKDEDKKIKAILARLHRYGITTVTEANVAYALDATQEPEDAFQLCVLLQDTYEGLVVPYQPRTTLLGAVNREGVTCYLDALLFAMFARLDSFEAMLYKSLEDPARKRLAGLLRLWVNMLRSGRLITTDLTMNLQSSLAQCGWAGAVNIQQQDTSEAFTFITDKLELPLLTLKMDMFHTGEDEPDSDHKFVNERLLEVAILPEPVNGQSVVTLEDCLENYFNNRVDVRRHLEQQRRSSINSPGGPSEKGGCVEHIEALPSQLAIPSAVDSPLRSPMDSLRSPSRRSRADSIFSQKRREQIDASDDSKSLRPSAKTEVLMPAFQFFKLLPWYTDNIPTSDAQVAAHFARKRPVLGICLKRYTVSAQGVTSRLDTHVDIPLEIALPDFLSDDNIQEDSPLVGNFKLVLQSLVCHRGSSVHSGHYVSLVRGGAESADNGRGSTSSLETEDTWMLFDDLAPERVRHVEINDAMTQECPYLLFYQVQPIVDPGNPPSYAEAISRQSTLSDVLSEKMALPEYTSAGDTALLEVPSSRNSMDVGGMLDDGHTRSSPSTGKRSSVVMDDGSRTSTSGMVTPNEEKTGFFPSAKATRRSIGKASHRGSAADGGSKFTLSMGKLTSRMKGEPPSPVADGDVDTSLEESLGTGTMLQAAVSRPSSRNARRSIDFPRRKDKGTAMGATSGSGDAVQSSMSKRLKAGRVPDRDCVVM